MKKKIIIGGVVFVLLAFVVAVIAIGTHLGEIVKSGVQTVGPKITQTTVTVDAVNITILSGSAQMKGFVLGNPRGYQTPQAISVGIAAVSLSPGSLLKDKIVVHSIELRSPEITFEGNPLGENNLMQILHNVNGGAAAVDASTNAPAAATPAEKKAARKLQVDDLVIAGAKVHASLPGILNRPVDLTLPDIHLTNLGAGPDGITAADLAQKVLSAITDNTVKAVTVAATEIGRDAANAAKSTAREIVNGALSGTNNVGESVDKLKKGLGGLLGK
ncbi:MAG TPA: hypothetical protein VF988_09870 [Verrucomicrobiae bacterium]